MTRTLAVLLALASPAMASNERPPSTNETTRLSPAELAQFLRTARLQHEWVAEHVIVRVKAKQGDVLWIRNKAGAYCRSGQEV